MSYGFYVFHDLPRLFYAHLAAQLVAGMTAHQWQVMTAVIGFPATLAISYLSFRFFETPFLRLKDKFGA